VDRIANPHQSFVPSEFRSLIERSTKIDPEERFQTASQMRTELEQIFDGDFCSICPRTLIKSQLHRYMHWLDWQPVMSIALTAFMVVALLLGFAGAGFWLGRG